MALLGHCVAIYAACRQARLKSIAARSLAVEVDTWLSPSKVAIELESTVSVGGMLASHFGSGRYGRNAFSTND
jgi:hypothetical protein